MVAAALRAERLKIVAARYDLDQGNLRWFEAAEAFAPTATASRAPFAFFPRGVAPLRQ